MIGGLSILAVCGAAATMPPYPRGHFPIFEGYDHMQYQIRDPKGFAAMLASVMERNELPELPFIR